jgi:hypothetical protein
VIAIMVMTTFCHAMSAYAPSQHHVQCGAYGIGHGMAVRSTRSHEIANKMRVIGDKHEQHCTTRNDTDQRRRDQRRKQIVREEDVVVWSKHQNTTRAVSRVSISGMSPKPST